MICDVLGGILREGGGVPLKCIGPAFVRVVWEIAEGPGVLEAVEDFTNANGVATAVYTATGAVEDDEVLITATCKVPVI